MTAVVGTKRIRALLITGPIVFGVPYLTGIGLAAGLADESDKGEAIGYAAIPLFGPIIAASEFHMEEAARTGIYALTVMQHAGVALTILGLTIKREVKEVRYVTLGDDQAVLSLGPAPITAGAGIALTLGPAAASF